MQDDGSPQSLENELLVDLTFRLRRGSGSLSTPPPHPISKQGRAACVGTKNLFFKDPVQTQDPNTCCRGRSSRRKEGECQPHGVHTPLQKAIG